MAILNRGVGRMKIFSVSPIVSIIRMNHDLIHIIPVSYDAGALVGWVGDG